MHKARIIGVSGQLGSGKDTVADYLVKEHGFVRIALADPIKRFGYHVFLFSEQQLWGPSHFRNAVDPRYYKDSLAWAEAQGRLEAWGREYCRSILGTDDIYNIDKAYKSLVHWFFWLQMQHPTLSPRVMLQTLGTEWGREAVSQDIWINLLLTQAKTVLHEDGSTGYWDYDPLLGPTPSSSSKLVRGVVISDVRFSNEFTAIREAGGSVIRVVRPDTDSAASKTGIEGHLSEVQDFEMDNFDFMLQNVRGIQELQQSVNTFMFAFNNMHF